MKFLDKLGFVLFSMIVLILALSLCMMGFGWVDPNIYGILISKVLVSQNGTYIFIGVSIVITLLAIRCLFFSNATFYSGDYSNDDDGILLQNEDGKLLITKKTIESIINNVTRSFPSIVTSETTIKMDKENNVIVFMNIGVKEGTIIKDVSSKLQAKVKKAVKDDTDLDLKEVNINIDDIYVKKEQSQDTNDDIDDDND